MREDGAYVEAGENDNLIVQKLEANPDAFGIFGFSFLDQNLDKLQGSVIDGVEPTFENIADGEYPVSRPLFFYVKNAHVGVVPGIKEYVAEFTSEAADRRGRLPRRQGPDPAARGGARRRAAKQALDASPRSRCERPRARTGALRPPSRRLLTAGPRR